MAFGGEVMGESLAQTSLSSSLMVSSTFDVLCLMTLTNCGGATSVMNLAIRAFAILGASEEIMRSMGVFFFFFSLVVDEHKLNPCMGIYRATSFFLCIDRGLKFWEVLVLVLIANLAFSAVL